MIFVDGKIKVAHFSRNQPVFFAYNESFHHALAANSFFIS